MTSKRKSRVTRNQRAAFPQRARQEHVMSKKSAGRRLRQQLRRRQRSDWRALAAEPVTSAPASAPRDAPDDARQRVRRYGQVRATSTAAGASSAVRMPTGSVHESSTASSSTSASLGRGR